MARTRITKFDNDSTKDNKEGINNNDTQDDTTQLHDSATRERGQLEVDLETTQERKATVFFNNPDHPKMVVKVVTSDGVFTKIARSGEECHLNLNNIARTMKRCKTGHVFDLSNTSDDDDDDCNNEYHNSNTIDQDGTNKDDKVQSNGTSTIIDLTNDSDSDS